MPLVMPYAFLVISYLDLKFLFLNIFNIQIKRLIASFDNYLCMRCLYYTSEDSNRKSVFRQSIHHSLWLIS